MKSKAWICATERLTPHCPPRLPQWRMNSVAAGDSFEWASLISVITEISDERSFESRGFWPGRFVWFRPEPTVAPSRQPTLNPHPRVKTRGHAERSRGSVLTRFSLRSNAPLVFARGYGQLSLF